MARLLWKVDHKEIIEFPNDGITSNSSFEMRMTIQTPGASVNCLNRVFGSNFLWVWLDFVQQTIWNLLLKWNTVMIARRRRFESRGTNHVLENINIYFYISFKYDFVVNWLIFYQKPVPQADRHRQSTGSFIPYRESVRIGVYRGNVVAVKRINKKSVDLNRTILKELNSVNFEINIKVVR